MKTYLRIIIKLIKLNFEKDVVYRFNAFFTLIATIVYTVTFILSASYVFKDIGTVMGVTYSQFFTLIMLAQLWWYLNLIFVRKNFQYIIGSINNGTLDSLLLKPLNLRGIIPFIQFDFRHVTPVFITVALLI